MVNGRMPHDAVLSLEDAIRLIELKENATTLWTAKALREQGVPDTVKPNQISQLYNLIRRQVLEHSFIATNQLLWSKRKN